MQYFRNADIEKEYPVNESTVRRWIRMSKEGKLDLALVEVGNKAYVANTARNIETIKRLIENNRKFRNPRAAKRVAPRPEFYKLYNQAQIYDIVTNLSVHHEIPRQFNYFDGGAHNWDNYVQHLMADKVPSQPASTIKLLEKNRGYIDDLLDRYKRINVVDIGPGNVLPVRDFLAHLVNEGKLGRYLALDVSAEMLDIARANVKEWFGGAVSFEGYQMDINYERFSNLLAEESMRKDADKTVNIVLFLGGTPFNFRNPDRAFSVVHDSMDRGDLLFYTDKLDTQTNRRFFDFHTEPEKLTALAPNHRFIFDLLNVDESFYDVEMGFDKELRQRYIQVRLKVALSITFNFDAGVRTVEFEKGDAILLWRFKQHTALEMEQFFDRNGFSAIQASQTDDQDYILLISRVKAE